MCHFDNFSEWAGMAVPCKNNPSFDKLLSSGDVLFIFCVCMRNILWNVFLTCEDDKCAAFYTERLFLLFCIFQVKFRFFKNATQFATFFHLIWHLLSKFQIMLKIFSIFFVDFSECLNFMKKKKVFEHFHRSVSLPCPNRKGLNSWVFSNQKTIPCSSIQLRIEFFIMYFFSGIQCSSRIPLLQRPWTPGGLSNVRLFSRYVVIRVHVGQHDFPQRAILSRPRQLRSGKYWFLFPTSFRIYCLKFDEFWISFFREFFKISFENLKSCRSRSKSKLKILFL